MLAASSQEYMPGYPLSVHSQSSQNVGNASNASSTELQSPEEEKKHFVKHDPIEEEASSGSSEEVI